MQGLRTFAQIPGKQAEASSIAAQPEARPPDFTD